MDLKLLFTRPIQNKKGEFTIILENIFPTIRNKTEIKARNIVLNFLNKMDKSMLIPKRCRMPNRI